MLLITTVAHAETNPATERDYAKKLDKENVEFLKELASLVEAKGYRDVQVIPQMFVVTAKNPDGKLQTLIIDSNSLKAFALDGELPMLLNSAPETTIPGMR